MLKKDGYIGHIVFDNPENHNVFDEALIQTLLAHLETLKADSSIRVILFSAQGKSFSAGANLHWMQKMAAASEKENQEDALELDRLMHTIFTFPKPTIALVQGDAYGGALGILAGCDLVLASPEAHFCFSEVKLGLIPAVISPYVITAIGFSKARRYFVTAERFSAQTALDMGLVHELSHNLQEDGLAYAQQIAKNSPSAIQSIKALIHTITHQPIDKNVRQQTAAAIAKARVSAEGQEGLAAFFNKRAPNWSLS